MVIKIKIQQKKTKNKTRKNEVPVKLEKCCATIALAVPCQIFLLV